MSDIEIIAPRDEWLVVLEALRRYGYYLVRRSQREGSFEQDGFDACALRVVRAISADLARAIDAPEEKVFR